MQLKPEDNEIANEYETYLQEIQKAIKKIGTVSLSDPNATNNSTNAASTNSTGTSQANQKGIEEYIFSHSEK